MTYRCEDCKKLIETVADIRGCTRCQARGTAAGIPNGYADSDAVTLEIVGTAGNGYATACVFTKYPPDPSVAKVDPDA